MNNGITPHDLKYRAIRIPSSTVFPVSLLKEIFSLLQGLISKISPTIYVQIWESRIKATNINTGKVFDEKPLVAIETTKKGKQIISAVGNNASSKFGNDIQIVNPFSHPRVLFSDFSVGEKLLQRILHIIIGNSKFSISPRIVIHPMEKNEGGFTQIEIRAFKELAAGAGGREVVVYEGIPLSTRELDFEKLTQKDLDSKNNKSENPKAGILYFVILIVFVALLILSAASNGN